MAQIKGEGFARDGFPDQTFLLEMVSLRMPFGRFEGRFLDELPVSYLEWFAQRGFPQGKLGEFLATMYEIRINGLDFLIKPLVKTRRG